MLSRRKLVKPIIRPVPRLAPVQMVDYPLAFRFVESLNVVKTVLMSVLGSTLMPRTHDHKANDTEGTIVHRQQSDRARSTQDSKANFESLFRYFCGLDPLKVLLCIT